MGEERSFRQARVILEQLYWDRGGFVKRDSRIGGEGGARKTRKGAKGAKRAPVPRGSAGNDALCVLRRKENYTDVCQRGEICYTFVGQ